MQRVTITIDDDLVAEIDAFMAGRGYANRSEAIRDLARAGLSQSSFEAADRRDRDCVATLSYVYDHAERQLPKRLTRDFHAHHGLAQATLHVHLDQDSCLEVTVLKGRSAKVKAVETTARLLPGSSLMPGKVNPTQAEALTMV
jgi:CopG family transcriptional regulator, nickel-responsive regulator